MRTIPWTCPRAATCRALFTGHTLAIPGPAGVVAVSFNGSLTTMTADDGSSIAVELDVFDVVAAIFTQLMIASGAVPSYSFPFVDGKFASLTTYDDPAARRAAEVVLWRAIAEVAPQWIPRPLAEDELRVRAGIVATASAALKVAREEHHNNSSAATLKESFLAHRTLDAADDALSEAHAYQAFVANLRADVEGIDLVEATPPTARMRSVRPQINQ